MASDIASAWPIGALTDWTIPGERHEIVRLDVTDADACEQACSGIDEGDEVTE
jgi:hypothetical protein